MTNYSKPPTVLVSPKHSTAGGNVDPKHNGISAWIEVSVINKHSGSLKKNRIINAQQIILNVNILGFYVFLILVRRNL